MASFEDSVFINCPFDSEYRAIFFALVFAVHDCGYIARCALEVDDSGLARPVIWSCKKDDFDNVHFDTRQYNHIVWQTPADLREQLRDRIKATIPGAA